MNEEEVEFALALLETEGIVNYDGPFTLVSGRKSPYYIELRMLDFYPDLRRMAVNLLYWKIARFNHLCDLIVPVPVGGRVLVYDLSLQMRKPFFEIREEKTHGTNRVEEELKKRFTGKKAIIVEDTVGTGTSTMEKAIQPLLLRGVHIIAVLSLFDREEGGQELFMKESVLFHSIFQASTFFRNHYLWRKIDRRTYSEIKKHLKHAQNKTVRQ